MAEKKIRLQDPNGVELNKYFGAGNRSIMIGSNNKVLRANSIACGENNTIKDEDDQKKQVNLTFLFGKNLQSSPRGHWNEDETQYITLEAPQMVVGKYNKPVDGAFFIVGDGNGKDKDAAQYSNALVVSSYSTTIYGKLHVKNHPVNSMAGFDMEGQYDKFTLNGSTIITKNVLTNMGTKFSQEEILDIKESLCNYRHILEFYFNDGRKLTIDVITPTKAPYNHTNLPDFGQYLHIDRARVITDSNGGSPEPVIIVSFAYENADKKCISLAPCRSTGFINVKVTNTWEHKTVPSSGDDELKNLGNNEVLVWDRHQHQIV